MKKIISMFLIIVMLCSSLGYLNVYAGVEDVDIYDTTSSLEDVGYFYANDTGRFIVHFYEEVAFHQIESSNSDVIQVDNDGNYVARSGGKAVVTFKGYDASGDMCFNASYSVYVYGDTSNMKLSTNSINGSMLQGGDYTTTIRLIDAPNLDISTFSYSCSNKNVGCLCTLNTTNKTISVLLDIPAKGTITFNINNNKFVVNFNILEVRISKTSIILAKGKTKKVKLKNYSQKATWKTTNKKVAKISSTGVIKAKKVGNTVFYTKIGNAYTGCVVSVVTSKMLKIYKKSQSIKKGKYSQAKRMKKGYYDCSSLVWRAYKAGGVRMMFKFYAPTAADLAKYYRKKRIKGGISNKNIKNMKLRVGDLFFCEGAKNGRYRGIYHVEMITGYELYGFSAKGKPSLGLKWANRPQMAYYGNYVVRPKKWK